MAGLSDQIIGAESGGNPLARNSRSSAGGAGQFIDSTWLRMVAKYRPDLAAGKTREQVLQLKFDPTLSKQMTDAYAGENSTFLKSRGFEATPGNTYLAHFAGPSGAAAILADPGRAVEATLGADAIRANPFLRGKTNSEVAAWAGNKMSPSGSMASNLRQRFGTKTTGGATEAPQAAAKAGPAQSAPTSAGGMDRLKAALGYDPDRLARAQKLEKQGQDIAAKNENWAGALGGTLVAGLGGYMQSQEAGKKKKLDDATVEALTSSSEPMGVIQALLANPAYRDAGLDMLIKAKQPKPNETLAPGHTVYDPNSKQAVYTAPDKPKLSDVAQRAVDAGLTPGTPEFADFVKSGPERQATRGNPLTNEAEIRKEYNAASKDFQTQLAGADRVNIGAKTDSAQGDMALVYGFMKMLDPASVVREGEFATAENTGGIPDRIRILYNKAYNGERLTPEMRSQFVSQSEAQIGAARARQQAVDERYSGIAQRHGFDPKNIITAFAPSPSAEREPPKAPPGQPGQRQAALMPPPAAQVPPQAPPATAAPMPSQGTLQQADPSAPPENPMVPNLDANFPRPAEPAGPVRVQSLDEAMALQPGTPFITPDGRPKVR